MRLYEDIIIALQQPPLKMSACHLLSERALSTFLSRHHYTSFKDSHPGLLRFARNDGGRIVIANPKGEAIQTGKDPHAGLLRSAMCRSLAMTRGLLAMTGCPPDEAELSLRDGGNTVAVGEAIQPGKALFVRSAHCSWGSRLFKNVMEEIRAGGDSPVVIYFFLKEIWYEAE
ncbi:MAG: hypothetical protein LBT00_15390 [Spirochaetaceae bacterium]|nr:hypothetical protein [Spirochaetaceae bacterium]